MIFCPNLKVKGVTYTYIGRFYVISVKAGEAGHEVGKANGCRQLVTKTDGLIIVGGFGSFVPDDAHCYHKYKWNGSQV